VKLETPSQPLQEKQEN